MGKTLTEISQQLRAANKKVQLIYAFNGTGKTRLSRKFKADDDEEADQAEFSRNKMLYYNAFTEDLFYWDNNLALDAVHKLKIQPNSFTDWVLKDQGQDQNIITNFQRYANDKLTPRFNEEYKAKGEDDKEVTVKAFSEVTFSLERGDDERTDNLKISKGEENSFIWSIFYSLVEQAILTLNDVQPDFPEQTPFDSLEYVFIDDPVSSLDDNHLIQLAIDLAQLIKLNKSNIKFVITTHSPLFFNVLCNEFGSDEKTDRYSWKSKWFSKSRLEKDSDGSLNLSEQPNDSPFAYHLHLIALLEEAIKTGQIEKYHFNLLRNVLEKTATFLGYKRWELLLPDKSDGLPDPVAKRIVNFSSHSKHAAEEVAPLKPEEKQILVRLVEHIIKSHGFWQQKEG
ncbi:AAA family ATPase [Zoogloea dura]|jgi:wobble nucleotide-excising tRNase|uniref:AAA family ATPase n=1 Tax=Zoogloea dura TaxID=2728840 RepID=A0A848G1X2_9RHOO|nr:AAA family ATPase [Zoogloea dura]NML26197.1 AAA family ATPase [Zoogloea dura]